MSKAKVLLLVLVCMLTFAGCDCSTKPKSKDSSRPKITIVAITFDKTGKHSFVFMKAPPHHTQNVFKVGAEVADGWKLSAIYEDGVVLTKEPAKLLDGTVSGKGTETWELLMEGSDQKWKQKRWYRRGKHRGYKRLRGYIND